MSRTKAVPAGEATESQSSTIVIVKDFAASENGAVVEEYKAGEEYETLPPIAAQYAITIGAVSDEDAEKLKAALAAVEAES